jgi:hypothetical protein
MPMASVKCLLGKTMVSVEADEVYALEFTTDDGRRYKLHHDQDCCESVTIESIVGDLADLVGTPLLIAEEIRGESPDGWEAGEYTESYTWTFYKFATRKGYVDVRWFGESNGYYSESVDFAEVTGN